MSEKLLDEFPKPTYEEWLKLVENQLKGVPFEKKLMKTLFKGTSIKPLYQSSDVQGFQGHSSPSGRFPFIRGSQSAGHTVNAWEITQQLRYPTVEQLNEAVCFDIPRGLSRFSIILDSAGKHGQDPDTQFYKRIGEDGVSIFCLPDMTRLFDKIDLADVSLQIEAGGAVIPFFSMLIAHLKETRFSLADLHGTVIFDPLSSLASTGTLDRAITDIYAEMASLMSWTKQNTPSLKVLGIDLRPYYEGGGHAVQELAFAIATGTEYVRELLDRECDLESIEENLQFILCIGSDFFTEIAKFRALRSLWSQVVRAFGGKTITQKGLLQGHSSQRNKSITDPHVNILRTTTEAFSGVIGGCDIIGISPFDELSGLPDAFSRRVARNLQIIIREECHGHKTIDPSGGSWFIENLTNQIARNAWTLFQEIEEKGGMLKCLKDGYIQQMIVENKQQQEDEVVSRKHVVVGSNMYANLEEEALKTTPPDLDSVSSLRLEDVKEYAGSRTGPPNLEKLHEMSMSMVNGNIDMIEAAIEAASNQSTLGESGGALSKRNERITITFLQPYRDSEQYEDLRRKSSAYRSKTGSYPSVFLANMGPVQQHKARVDFTIDFLKPGGFSTIVGNGYESPSKAAEAALKSKAKIVVICSSDDTYPELVPELSKLLKNEAPETFLLVAGFPKDHIESFKSHGVDEFIHLRANHLKILQLLQNKVGIE